MLGVIFGPLGHAKQKAILLSSALLIYTPPYRRSYQVEQTLTEETARLFRQGIVEHLTSPWSSNVVLVKKKHGGIRFCVDFSKLNEITTKDRFPLPRINIIFDNLSDSEYFTTLDFKSGYHQIPLDRKDRPKTAFSTRDNRYQFTVLPQGVTNGSPTFQRIDNQILGRSPWKFSLAYLDDVIIYSRSSDEHLTHLDDILNRLSEANFRLNIDKYNIAHQAINFLCHRIELHMRTSCLMQRKPAGCSTHRYQQVQNKRIDLLQTDASQEGIGAVLMQTHPNGDLPVAYLSQKFSSPQKTWSTPEKECLAILSTIEKWHKYLDGREFILETDHKSLIQLNQKAQGVKSVVKMSNRSISLLYIIIIIIIVTVVGNGNDITAMSNAVHTRASSSKILFVPFPLYSHLISLIPLAKQLQKMGHHCTFALFDKQIGLLKSKSSFDNQFNTISLASLNDTNTEYDAAVEYESNLQFLSRFSFPLILSLYEPMYKGLRQHLQTNHYDLFVIDVFSFAAYDLAYELNISYVIYSCNSNIGEELNLPAWLPSGFDLTTLTQMKQSYWTRFHQKIIISLQMVYYFMPTIKKLTHIRRRLNVNVSFFPLLNRNNPIIIPNPVAFEFRRSYIPIYHFVGFVIESSNSNLELTNDDYDIDMWLNKTENNEFVMLVVVGTITIINQRIWNEIIQTIYLVKNMRLLLATNDKAIKNILKSNPNITSDRLLIKSWINQQHVLNHKAIKIFFNHGGLHTVAESIYAHIPMIVMPSFGDQYANAVKIQEYQLGLAIHRDTITSLEISEKIHYILDPINYSIILKQLTKMHQLSELSGGASTVVILIDNWLLT
ncbi:unnamed protein product, partial [Didymodactylos carnosus]